MKQQGMDLMMERAGVDRYEVKGAMCEVRVVVEEDCASAGDTHRIAEVLCVWPLRTSILVGGSVRKQGRHKDNLEGVGGVNAGARWPRS